MYQYCSPLGTLLIHNYPSLYYKYIIFFYLQAAALSTNSSPQITAGNDWIVTNKGSVDHLHYKDEQETARFINIANGNGQDSRIIQDLSKNRFVCTQSAYALDVSDDR